MAARVKEGHAQMQSRLFALIGGALSLLGSPDRNAAMRMKAGKLAQAEADAIVRRCGAPPGTVTIKQRELLVYPAKDFSVTSCILDGLRATGEFTSPVGSTYYAPRKR